MAAVLIVAWLLMAAVFAGLCAAAPLDPHDEAEQ